LQPDGRILLAGQADTNNATETALVRLLVDGSLDPSYGSGGKVLQQWGDSSGASSMSIAADLSVTVAGNAYSATADRFYFAANRLLADGSQDPSFAGECGGTPPSCKIGPAIIAVGSYDSGAGAVVRQSDGKMLLGGSANDSQNSFAIVRLRNDGRP